MPTIYRERISSFESDCCKPGVECEEDEVDAGHDANVSTQPAVELQSLWRSLRRSQRSRCVSKIVDYLLAHGNPRERALALEHLTKAQQLEEGDLQVMCHRIE